MITRTKILFLLLFSTLVFPINSALANECALTIESNDALQFSEKEMSAPSTCKEVTLTLKHTGKLDKKVMGHNWVLAVDADVQELMQAALNAGADKGYMPEDRTKIIAATEMIGGGESTTITFSTVNLSKDGSYTFFCSFPGHGALMKGSFKLT